MVYWLERPLGVWEVNSLNPDRVIPNTLKMERAASLLDAQHFKRVEHRQTNHWLATRVQAPMGPMACSCNEVPCKGTYIRLYERR